MSVNYVVGSIYGKYCLTYEYNITVGLYVSSNITATSK